MISSAVAGVPAMKKLGFWLRLRDAIPCSESNNAVVSNLRGTVMIKRNLHLLIDDRKLWMSQAVLEVADLPTIRAVSLSNIQRWKAQGVWGRVYDQWQEIMAHAGDDEIIHIMTGDGDEPNRLRQSMPYTGIIDEETRQKVLARYHKACDENEVPDPQTVGQQVKRRRRALGLTQQRLANLAEVSRRTIRRLEASTAGDLDRLFFDVVLVLGLSVDTLSLVAREKKKGLWMAARSSSISYTTEINEDQLRQALASGEAVKGVESNLRYFLDEVKVQMVVMAIEETARLESVHPARIWPNLDKLAAQLSQHRALLWAY
jgi:transcriptional regulator with XRE-family HTH domain